MTIGLGLGALHRLLQLALSRTPLGSRVLVSRVLTSARISDGVFSALDKPSAKVVVNVSDDRLMWLVGPFFGPHPPAKLQYLQRPGRLRHI